MRHHRLTVTDWRSTDGLMWGAAGLNIPASAVYKDSDKNVKTGTLDLSALTTIPEPKPNIFDIFIIYIRLPWMGDAGPCLPAPLHLHPVRVTVV